MTKAFDTEPVLKGGLSETSFTETHIFTCDSPVVRNWLCSFTKTDLDFISYHDTFQKIINKGATGKPQRLNVLSSIMDTNKGEYLNITVWRDKGRNGEYKKYEKLSEWEFKDTKGLIAAEGAVYNADNLELNEFEIEPPEDQTVNVPDPEEPKAPYEPPEDATDEELEEYKKKQEEYEELFEEYQVKLVQASLERKEATLSIDREISKSLYSKMFAGKLIRLNDYINGLKIEEWEDWELKDKVRFEFLVDIRSSKERAVNWTSTITYYQASTKSVDKPPQDNTDSAGLIFGRKNKKGEVVDKNDPPPTTNEDETDPVTEPDPETAIETITVYETELQTECNNKLYLYSLLDGEVDDSRSVCLKNLKFASSKSLYDFGSFLRREDGKLFQHLINANPNNQVAAPLDLQYNEYLGKWESGSPQMIAIISEGVPAAEGPDIDSIEKNPIDILLDPEQGQEITYGYAIPYHMQNANPRQWSAIYDTVEELRDNDHYDKSKIKVHNITKNAFARGDIVLLSRVEGLWFPIISLGGDPVQKPLEPADPQWEFMYLMTSCDFHFRNVEHSGVTPFSYEKGFYRNYYDIFASQESAIETQNGFLNQNRYDESFSKYANVKNEYFQISSFDYVNPKLGGLRSGGLVQPNDTPDFSEGHAISNTIYGENLDGTTNGDGEKLKTYPFFGCVFPQGHSASSFINKILNATTPTDYADVKDYGQGNPFTQYSLMSEITYDNTNLEVNNAVIPLISPDSDKQALGLLSNLEDQNLKHVPADIATNAGPNGRWGRPIEWVGYFDLKNTELWGTQVNEYNSCNTFLSRQQQQDKKSTIEFRGSYLYTKGIGEDTPVSGYDNYWYDIQPLNHYSLQFRPLSRELYASFEGYNASSNTYSYDRIANDNIKRGNLAFRMYSAIDGYGPLSKTSWHRNQTHLENSITGKIEPKGLLGDYGLKYSSDLVYLKEFAIDNRITNLPANVEGTDDGYPSKWWDSDWMKSDGETTRPAGGIGIIGAATTVRSVGNISLSTDNAIGLGDYLVVTNPLEYASTMKNGDYNDQLTTALYARVYQHHPRNLTWYDPRFMVVHHFNPGDGRTSRIKTLVEYESEQDDLDVVFEESLSRFRTLERGIFNNYATHESGIIFLDSHPNLTSLTESYDPAQSGYFKVDKVEYAVDFRIPTNWEGNNIKLSSKGVFSDSSEDLDAKLSSASNSVVHKIRQSAHWNVNTNRRSKLLPYSYKFKSIGIGIKGVQFAPINDQVDIANHNTVVIDKGSGYKVGDKFETVGGNGGGAIFTVTSVETEDVDGQTLEGRINGLEISSETDRGLRYRPEDFIAYLRLNSEDEWEVNNLAWDDENTPSSSISLQPLANAGVTGNGFVAYVLYGEIILTSELMDPKPLEALDVTGPIKLTPDIPRNDINRNQGQVLIPQATNFQIINKHTDNKYDIFLRYHNDITHVAMDDIDTPLASEQQVTIEIGVNLGQEPTANTSSDQLAGMLADQLSGGVGNDIQFLLDNMNDGFNTSDGDQAADQAGSFLGFGGGVGGNSSFR